MLHHLQDYRAGLEHLKSLARPGGTVALVDNVCRELYGSAFPGARFDDLDFALAMSWTAPRKGDEVQ